MKSIAHLYLEKHEQLSEAEKEVLLLAVKMEATPIFTSTIDGNNIRVITPTH